MWAETRSISRTGTDVIGTLWGAVTTCSTGMGDIAGAMIFLRNWLSRASETVHAADTPTEIERYVFTVVALLAGFSEEADTAKDLRLLHEMLERFCCGAVSREYAMAALDRNWAGGIGNFMSGGEDPNLEKNLRVALETRTTLTELQTLLEMLRQGEPVPKESPLFLARDGREDQLGRDFHAALLRADKWKHLCERRDQESSVSCCNLRFSAAAAADYRLRRIAQCTMCKRFNLRLRP